MSCRSLRPKVQQQGTGSSTTPSSIGVLMINFCVALTALYTSFIIPNYITRSSSSDVACAALSAMFHYFFLVSALAFTLMVFLRFRKFEKRKNVVVLVTAVVITWGTWMQRSASPLLYHARYCLPFSGPTLRCDDVHTTRLY